jgi:PEP-CTERM motif
MKAIFLAAAILASVPAAAVTVVDFNSQPAPVSYSNSAFIDNGYIFTAGAGFGYLWNGASPNSNGTNNLINGFSLSNWTITKVGGGAFTLVSLDLAISWYSASTNELVTVGAAPVNYTTTLTAYVVNQTGSSITIAGSPVDGYWTADNFVFDAAVVPEPATWAMLIAGFGLVGFAARRRRHTAVAA